MWTVLQCSKILLLELRIQYVNFFSLVFIFSQIPITLHKETEVNENGEEVMKCGFKIGGGIDQDFRKSPQGYTDNVSINLLH